MRETSSSNYSPVRRAQSFPNNKTAYEQIKLEDQQSHAEAFVKLNKNAPYAAGQMNKLWAKKSICPITVCLPAAGVVLHLIDAGR